MIPKKILFSWLFEGNMLFAKVGFQFSQHFIRVFNFIFIFYILSEVQSCYCVFLFFLLNTFVSVYFNVILSCQCKINLGSWTRDMKIGQKKKNKDDWMWRHRWNNKGENIIPFNYRRILLSFLNIKYPFLTSIFIR